MSIHKQDWIFEGDRANGFVALLAYHLPPSVERSNCHWIRTNEQVDGMRCGQLEANVLPLPVARNRLIEILKATDWHGVNLERGWRHDLSLHNTSLDTSDDSTVQAYIHAIHALGLSWTPPEAMSANPFGWRLAQAVYPFDPSQSNWDSLGLKGNAADALGEPVNPARHVIVLLTEGDD
ncbi:MULTISPECIES: hypothetical protein [unclassified Burkholderia]|uniref:hypothetical protein n=1 Tax=unclassified Burkholderia TaxID=2613784 RepID=UPI000F5EB8E3|nr:MULTISPECIES: hypothetical protein [unclassified Burkholderia]